MKVLVTGADGFIGSHLAEALVRAGHEVRALAQYNAFSSFGWLDESPRDVLQEMELVAGDVRDPHQMALLVAGCDAVLHLAALIGIPFSYHAPDAYLETNVRGTLNVLQAARRHGTPRVVITSTSEVYGTAKFVPITEEHPLQGQSPYSASKIAADQMALAFYASFGTPVCVLRPFNTYGPRQSARAVIPTIIGQIAAGKRQLQLGALTPTRDFNYVSDTVAGFLAALGSEAAVGEVINLGSGFEISIGDLVQLIAQVMDVSVEVQTDSQRVRPVNSEVERLCASAAKAQRLLGWQPRLAGSDGLRRGIEATARWLGDPARQRRLRADAYSV